MNFTLCTNGDFLDGETADRVEKLNNLVALVSMDGLREKHDWRRGGGSYDKTAEAMQLLKDRRLLFGYMTTIMPYNRKEVSSEQFVEEMIKRGSMIGGYTLFLSRQDGETLSPKEYREVAENLSKIARDFPLYILSADFGYMDGDVELRHSKRLIAVTVGPSGEVRTERGNVPIGIIGVDGSLEEIISKDETQRIFREKLLGTGGADRDARLEVLQNI
jgi:MoaA/NifB/PqqE/SkfB family radical SAM enzyme